MGRCVFWTFIFTYIFLALCPVCALAQDPDNPYTVYAGAGIGLYSNFGKSNPNYNVDGGTDLLYQKLFAEVEGGADTANAVGVDNGYNVRGHGLLFYQGAGAWSYGGGIHYSEFKSSIYSTHDLWPTAALLYNRHQWLRINFQYLFPGENTNYHETGPLVDLRAKLTHGFYYRGRVGLLHYTDELQLPAKGHWAGEATFGFLYVFPHRQ